MSRSLPFWCVLLCLSSGLLKGQDCPAVPVIMERFFERPAAIPTIEAEVRQLCPYALDSLSVAYHTRSVYAYSSGEGLDQAITFAKRALAVQRDLYADSMALPLAKSLANLGNFYLQSDQPVPAERFLMEAEAAYQQLAIPRRLYLTRGNLVYLWQNSGDYGRAEELLHVMQAAAETNQNAKGSADIQRLFGRQYNQSHRYAKAIPHLEAAIAQFASLDNEAWVMQSQLELGRTYYHLRQYPAARQVSQAALKIAESLGADATSASLYNHLGLIDLRAGRQAEAATWFSRAVNAAEERTDAYRLAVALDNTAEWQLEANRPEEAVATIRRAIGVLVPAWAYSSETPLPSPTQMAAATDRTGIFIYLGDLARALVATGQATAAREALATADKLADELRADYGSSLSKLFWREEALPIYDLALQLSQEAGDQETAFYFLEKSRSILLLEALLREDADAVLPEALQDELAARNRALRTSQQLLSEINTTKADSLRNELVQQRNQVEALRNRIGAEYPQVTNLVTNPEMASLAEARALLATEGWDRQLLFFLGGDTARVLSVTATDAELHQLGPTKNLEALVSQLLTYFTDATAIDQDPKGFLAASAQVHGALLGALDLAAGESLLLLPDGILSYLPFAALVTEPGRTDLATAPYLLHRNPTSYAQSTTVLQRQINRRQPIRAPSALAFAPFTEALVDNDAPPLPFSNEEVASLTDVYPTTTHTQSAASKKVLLAELASAPIAHLSTHAYATARGDAPPRILTATDPVYLSDIYALRLNAELVTLSACQSNIGPLAKGEGVLGLGRAFTAAGARGVVASLWSLNDRATADISSSFYHFLAEDHPKPLALHQAQLAYLERTDLPAYLKSPYYWAGLTYYGDAGQLPTKQGMAWWGWLALCLVFVALLMVFIGNNKK